MYTFNELDRFLDSIGDKYKVPGYSIRVFHKGKLAFSKSGGFSDRENKIPMQGDEYFYIYSASKPITCTAAMRAFEEGAFLLGEPVWWYLPEFRDCKVKEYLENGEIKLVPLKRDILIQDLFSMSAGLNYYTESPEIKEAIKNTNGKAPTREIARAIAKMPLEFQPGENFGYSLCHDVLAAVVEVATGVRFSEYVRDRIFTPLGMNKTTYRINDDILAHMAQQYRYNDETGEAELFGKTNAYIFGSEYDSGGAGVITTIDDYSKFAYALVNGGVGETGARIISKRTIDLMRTNLMKGKALESFSSWESNREYGYGYGVKTKIGEGKGGNLSAIGEFGWDGAAGALISIDPELELAIVYFQFMLNPRHNLTHPRIRNMAILATQTK